MDVRLKDGDVFLTDAGATAYLYAAYEAVQRALIAASTVKGSFIYQRRLGTDYGALDGCTELKDRLDMLVSEATAGIADTQVSVTDADAERMTAVIAVTHGGTTMTAEVDLNGNI